MFKPCCERLKNALADTILSNPNHVSNEEEDKIAYAITHGVVIDAHFVDDDLKED
jgi:hypothetical protein